MPFDNKKPQKQYSEKRDCKGFSFVDTLLGIVLVGIVVIGILSFRYQSVLNLHKAQYQESAAYVAELLCQSWKGVNGNESFDPLDLFDTMLNIEQKNGMNETDTAWPTGFVLLKTYVVMIDSIPYYAALGYRDIQPGLRGLTVMVAWTQRGLTSGREDGGRWVLDNFDQTDKIYRLTTYVNTD
jgi:hypothetical protein